MLFDNTDGEHDAPDMYKKKASIVRIRDGDVPIQITKGCIEEAINIYIAL